MAEILSRFIECIVFIRQGVDFKFLCLKRSGDAKVHPGIWQIVTAKIDEGEKAYETAKREVTEETGLKPVNFYVAPFVNQFYNFIDDSVNLIPVFIVETDSEDVKISYEHSEYKWLNFEDAHGKIYWQSQKKILAEVYNHLKNKELFNTLRKIK
ncbi:MAG: NUDIX pyrophosphatase [Ignavibacteria bacterium]|nr:NUDIX pyrophosphatase [Ignavibacteria bacterium]